MAAGSLSDSIIAGKMSAFLQRVVAALAQPRRALWLRRGIMLLAALWLLLAAAQLLWALVPAAQSRVAVEGAIINPPAEFAALGAARAQVDIEALREWALFGQPGATVVEEPEPAASEVRSVREGIERGARETRLELTLRGIIAFNADGEGSAIIEHRSSQAIYAVDDELPVAGKVVLAKVMPGQVVLDNGGTYELLRLYPPGALDAQMPGMRQAVAPMPRQPGPATVIDRRTDADAAALAASYRAQLYADPQSLADLVRISAVRDDGALRGYRVTPGQDRAQFEKLGFRAGDLVLAVNGLSLSDPANTMRLYQAMRSATEASFDLLRQGESVALSVRLDDAPADR